MTELPSAWVLQWPCRTEPTYSETNCIVQYKWKINIEGAKPLKSGSLSLTSASVMNKMVCCPKQGYVRDRILHRNRTNCYNCTTVGDLRPLKETFYYCSLVGWGGVTQPDTVLGTVITCLSKCLTHCLTFDRVEIQISSPSSSPSQKPYILLNIQNKKLIKQRG